MGGKKVTIGYEYRMGVHFGICHGPVDSVRGIRVGKRIAWSGAATESGLISITAKNLFGGQKKEGGIAGPFTLMMGEDDQPQNAYLTEKQGPMQPGYRGLVTGVFNGLVACMNPYPKPWEFKVRRILKGWIGPVWQPDLAVIEMDGGNIHAMNPAHIFYQTVTDPEWGMGYSESAIDLDVLEVAAQRLYDEGFGLCVKWNKSDSVENWIQMLADHCGAMVTTDRNTGKFRFDLVRADYEFNDLRIFGPNNIIEMVKYEPPALENSTNELTVTYRDPVSNNDGSVTLQSLASVQTQGRIVSAKKVYPGIPTGQLAARVAVRDLRSTSVGLKRVDLRVNREGYDLRPGQVIRFQWPADGIDIAMRIGEIDYGTLTDGTVSFTAVEDVFGLPDNTYLVPEESGWYPPVSTAVDMTVAKVREASYLDLAKNLTPSQLDAIGTSEGYLIAYGPPPNQLSMNFGLFARMGTSPYEEDTSGDLCPIGYSVNAVDYDDTSVTLEDFSLEEDISDRRMTIDFGDELCELTVWNPTTKVATIKRGVGDTVPKPHPVGTPVFVYGDNLALSPRMYFNGQTVDVKLITRTPSDELVESAATTRTVNIAHRQDRPYPPGRFRLNGAITQATVVGAGTVTWKHRNRITQNDQFVGAEEDNVTPERTTRYGLRFRDASNNLLVEKLDISGTSASFNLNFTGTVSLELWTITDNGNSWQSHTRTFTYDPGGSVSNVITADTYDPLDDGYVLDGGGA